MQTKDLLVTGDVKILGTLYAKNGIGGGGSGSSDTSGLQSAISNLNAKVDGLSTTLNGHTTNASMHQDTNTTYTISSGDSNGQIKITPSSGNAYNVSVKGLGTAAYTASGNYATPASVSNVSSTLTTHTNASNPHSDSMAKTNPTGTGTLNVGSGNTASGTNAIALGKDNSATGMYSIALGQGSTCAYTAGCAIGPYNTASNGQLAAGHGNKLISGGTGTSGYLFVLGNGAKTALNNAFAVAGTGATYTGSSINPTGADYAEYFEWIDQNENREDRRGYFVTIINNKIKKATPKDYILGIISGNPSVIGNSDIDWHKKFLKDEFGAYIQEDFEYETEELDEATNQVIKKKGIDTRWKGNPEYDSTKEYIQRADRPEWDAVGMLGVLSVRDDGTCEVNGYCGVADGGIATKAETGYRVIERVNDHIVKIVFR